MTFQEFLAAHPQSKQVLQALADLIESTGEFDSKVTRSQIAFCDDRPFAWAWAPDQYLGPGHAPLVLTLSFPDRQESKRWKSIVQTGKHRFTHHLELHSASDVDDELRGFIEKARRAYV